MLFQLQTAVVAQAAERVFIAGIIAAGGMLCLYAWCRFKRPR